MIRSKINTDRTYLGIELGSTRIKACLIDDTYSPIADGSFEWKNDFDGKYWTYSIESIHNGVQQCFKSLFDNVLDKYGVVLNTVGAIGVSAMMHGYLAFDENNNLLVPFRTWRNTTTKKASEFLSDLFNFNIPQRWSVAHLYQAILNNEPHIEKISHITTLAGYVHFLLTGKYETGIGDASGVFPVDGNDYNAEMLNKFDYATKQSRLSKKIREMLPKIKMAGEKSAYLTASGAAFLDPSGRLKSGIPVCPPEGDAGTGMVATNAVSAKSGNVSAGTSIFAMLVLEKSLKRCYSQIDVVTTPDGSPVAMVHCNNCCNELDSWINVFKEFSELLGVSANKATLYQMLYDAAVLGDCKGLMAYNYLAGEHITNIENGKPMYFRLPESRLTLAGFMKTQLYSAVSTLGIGMDILFNSENIEADRFSAHGGLFKVKGVAQQILANVLNSPVSVSETAGEGGSWGIALLAAYMMNKGNKVLGNWLEDNVFANTSIVTLNPENNGVEEFREFKKLYEVGLSIQQNASGVK